MWRMERSLGGDCLWGTLWFIAGSTLSRTQAITDYSSVEVAKENIGTWENVCDVMISKKKGYKMGHRVGSLFCNNDWKNTRTLAVVIPVVVKMTCISSWSLSIYSRFSAMNLEYDCHTYQDYFRRKFTDYLLSAY